MIIMKLVRFFVNITYTFTTAPVLHLSQKKVTMFWSVLAIQICELTRRVSSKKWKLLPSGSAAEFRSTCLFHFVL